MSSASAVGLIGGPAVTVRVSCAAPVSSTCWSSGAVVNVADWPGTSSPRLDSAVLARPLTPGSDEMAAGVPPGGFTTGCWRPSRARVTVRASNPPMPG